MQTFSGRDKAIESLIYRLTIQHAVRHGKCLVARSAHNASEIYGVAAWAAIQFPEADVRCITFGSPRVGNTKFKQAFNTLVGTAIRIINGADPVPFVPLSIR